MSFGRLGFLGRGFGRLGASGKTSAIATPVLAMDPQWTSAQNVPKFSIENLSSNIIAGWKVQLQIQTTGGSWSPTTQDITHTLTQPEIDAGLFSFGFSALANATYDARCRELNTSNIASNWSNIVTFTVNATVSSTYYILGF